MTRSAFQHNLRFAWTAGLVLWTALGCDSATPPPPPDASTSTKTATTRSVKTTDSGDSEKTADASVGDSKSTKDSTDTGIATDTATSDSASFTRGGAAVGADDDKANVKKCLDSGKF